VANFVANHNAECTFCQIDGVRPVARESFGHLFFDCPYSNNLISVCNDRLFGNKFMSDTEKKRFFYYGLFTKNGSEGRTLFSGTFGLLFAYSIWDCRLVRKKKPVTVFISDLCWLIKSCLCFSRPLSFSLDKFENLLDFNLQWARG
jgi:hypothetical protein